MHSLEVRIFDPLDIDQFAFAPESDFRNFLIEGIDAQVNLFSWISVDFELEMADRDFSVRVHGSIHSEAENILRRLERWPDFEFSEGRLFLF